MYNKYNDEDYILHSKVKNDEVILYTDPEIEEITKEDVVNLYTYVIKAKPKQLPVGEYKSVFCSDCEFEGVIYHKQLFCPMCLRQTLKEQSDPNEHFEKEFQKWQLRKNTLEQLVNGDILEFVDDFNSGKYSSNLPEEEENDSCMGDEVYVEEEEYTDPWERLITTSNEGEV